MAFLVETSLYQPIYRTGLLGLTNERFPAGADTVFYLECLFGVRDFPQARLTWLGWDSWVETLAIEATYDAVEVYELVPYGYGLVDTLAYPSSYKDGPGDILSQAIERMQSPGWDSKEAIWLGWQVMAPVIQSAWGLSQLSPEDLQKVATNEQLERAVEGYKAENMQDWILTADGRFKE